MHSSIYIEDLSTSLYYKAGSASPLTLSEFYDELHHEGYTTSDLKHL